MPILAHQKSWFNFFNSRKFYWYPIFKLLAPNSLSCKMVTGDKRTGTKKILFDSTGHYGRITDERDRHMDKCVKNKVQQILENSTDIRSESYWHQINCLVKRWLVTKEQVQKKYGLVVAGIMDKLRMNVTNGPKITFFGSVVTFFCLSIMPATTKPYF